MKIKINFTHFFLLILLLILTSCMQKKITPQTDKINQEIKLLKAAKLTVTGIECDFCVESVKNLLCTISGITDAKVSTFNQDATEVKLIYDSNFKLDQDEIKQILAREGFGLKSLVF